MHKYYILGKEFIAPSLNEGLYIVATPIGNLRDISLRALEVLAAVDLIICEDTRTSTKLLNHYGIKNKTMAFHEHNEKEKQDYIIKLLQEKKSIALISDAGTPLISDPGYPLVNAVNKQNINIFAIAGASALIAALSISGIASDRFSFFGFLPNRQIAKENMLNSIKQRQETLIFYESPRRLEKTIKIMQQVFGHDREATIALELSKRFERLIKGDLAKIYAEINDKQIKGEAVIIVAGAKEIKIDDEIWQKELKQSLKDNSLKSSVEEISKKYNLQRKKVYDAALKLKQKES